MSSKKGKPSKAHEDEELDEQVLQDLIDNVRRRRNELGYSQHEAARRAHLDLDYFPAFESGNRRNPEFRTLMKIARALETTLSALFTSPADGKLAGRKR